MGLNFNSMDGSSYLLAQILDIEYTHTYAKLMTGSFFYLLYTVNCIENTMRIRLCAAHIKQIGSADWLVGPA